MNKNILRSAALVTGGLLVGGGSGYLIAKKRLEKKYFDMARLEISEAKEYYKFLRKEAPYDDPSVALAFYNARLLEVEFWAENGTPTENVEEPPAIYNELIRERAAEKADEEEKSVAQKQIDGLLEAAEAIRMTVEPPTQAQRTLTLEDVTSQPTEIVENIFDKVKAMPLEELRKEMGEPYVIALAEFATDEQQYAKETLTYYLGDNVLVDDAERPIDDVEGTVGEINLEHFGHGSEDDDIVYVRNDKRDIDFEIVRVDKSYVEFVLGQDPPSE